MPYDPNTGIWFEVHGQGEPLLLGFPLLASYGEVFGAGARPTLDGFLAGLTDRWRVLVVDYPSIGRSATIAPSDLTAERVTADMLSVADAAGFDRFAYWGYAAFGAAVGLQLAARTGRLTALVAGGWSPLGAPIAGMIEAAAINVGNPPASSLVVLREPAQYAQWATFWGSLEDWSETEALARIACPALAYAGLAGEVESGGVDIGYARPLAAHKAALEAAGWTVVLLPDEEHGVGLDPAVMLPLVRPFLDRALA